MNDTLKTTCPSCHAVFRVKPQQLELRGGKVRCGKCAYVFNAFDTLVTPIETVSLMVPQDDAPPAAPDIPVEEKIEAIAQALPTISEPSSQVFPIPTDEQIDREAAAINREIAASSMLDEERKTPADDLMPEVSESAEPPAAETAPANKLHITPELQDKLQDLQLQLSRQEKRAHWRTLSWGLASLVLVLAFAGQAAYFLRHDIAARYPQAKPALVSMCTLLQCKVSLLADANLIKLDASDLQAVPDQPNAVLLSASLRNLATYAQAYPTLELTLTDATNQPLARRHFGPKEYLPATAKIEQGMPANEDVPVKLALELTDLNAVGYKLFVFYP